MTIKVVDDKTLIEDGNIVLVVEQSKEYVEQNIQDYQEKINKIRETKGEI